MTQRVTSNHFTDANGNPEGGQTYGPGLCIAWQRGPLGRDSLRLEENGCFAETVIRAAIDRLEFYQGGKFACEENEIAIARLYDAVEILQKRTQDREQRQVEGTHAA